MRVTSGKFFAEFASEKVKISGEDMDKIYINLFFGLTLYIIVLSCV